MAKTNFSKVEEQLDKGLLKMKVNHLLDLADKQNVTKQPKEEIQEEVNTLKKSKEALIKGIQHDLKLLLSKEKDLQSSLNIDVEAISKRLENPEDLTDEDWEQIKVIKKQIEAYSQDLLSPVEKGLNKDIIDFERNKHINKRYNIRDGWLPLK
jgi:viroplasmin and RNaseH domain-containing protein